MVLNNSLYESKLIAALLRDVHNAHGEVFNTRSLKLTLQKVNKRLRAEGISFLTKTLPRLGKAFDKALTEYAPLKASSVGFESTLDAEFPKFLGEFFGRVLKPDGSVLPCPCVLSIRVIRQVCYLYYKYKLPYTDEQEQQIVQRFEETEDDLDEVHKKIGEIQSSLDLDYANRRTRYKANPTPVDVAREAKILLSNVFAYFNPKDIQPRHGPGVVSTKERLWAKYLWSNISARITKVYPADEYYFVSQTHVCDRLDHLTGLTDRDQSARVILVPKDSRGPRLISCEPVDFQWIQQGLGRAIVDWVERHELTKFNVFFTDQGPNQRGALLGSIRGGYSTLDLNEASDRVSLGLVRLLFPPHICEFLEACRSSSTVLPDGRVLELKKFAPMGSCLCFPVLALTTWAILAAGAPDKDTRDRILVYGDDVIVPRSYSLNAIEHLESFGLKVNRDKSCTGGLFRESCGTDAYKGENVTPVRLRTVWSSVPGPSVYSSWIAYANLFYDRQYFNVYDLIVKELTSVYGVIPGDELRVAAPSLREVPTDMGSPKRRWNKNLQRFEYRVRTCETPSIRKKIDGWLMLLRYFAEKAMPSTYPKTDVYLSANGSSSSQEESPFDASSYTKRHASMLAWRWR